MYGRYFQWNLSAILESLFEEMGTQKLGTKTLSIKGHYCYPTAKECDPDNASVPRSQQVVTWLLSASIFILVKRELDT